MSLTPLKSNDAEALKGVVERVTFHSEESGFCVLRIKCRGMRDLVTLVGNLPNVVPGEMVEATGDWVMNKDHGRQFKAAQLKTLPPDSISGITRYLGSGLIKGIGPVYAGKLVEKFGKEIFEIIENNSARLEQVEGIGRVRRLRIKDSWNETREVRAIMAFLLTNGVSTARAFRIYKTYGDQAIQRVQEDPYCLCRDIRGIGFKTADQIAQNMGVEKESDLRARAGVEHVLSEITHEGHCTYPKEKLIEQAVAVLEIQDEIVERAVQHGITTGRLVLFMDPDGTALIYLRALYEAETLLARWLYALNEGLHPMPLVDEDKALRWVEDQIRLELDAVQQDAVRVALHSKVMVITGGPGVGKTTIINAILKIIKARKLQVVLCAPTGRAAKRMTETTGCLAKTVHRLLAWDAANSVFKHNDQCPLKGDVFVMDESSMLDIMLAWQFVRAVPRDAALILVGDVNQLPSVGPGSVLRDVIESDVIPVVRLQHVFRQAARSDIIKNAHRINEGKFPYLKEKGEHSDFFFAEAEEPDRAAELLLKMVSRAIPDKFGFKAIDDIQVLTPMRRGMLGAENLNRMLQERLNPAGESIMSYGCRFAVGDKVMQTANNYDKDVFNGDMGRITRLNREDGELVVSYDGRKVTYDLQELDELVPSYAITVHKSQGSEYPCVVIPVHTQHYMMLQRNLIYTAVTRGRKMVVLVGTKKALNIAVNRVDSRQRLTRLKWHLQQAAQNCR